MKSNLDKKKWRDVVGFEGLYVINRNGEVIGLPTIKKPYLRNRKNHIQTLPSGYKRVVVPLWKNGKSLTRPVSRLLAEAFIPNPKGLTQVNHKDLDPTNNYLSNLEWVSPSENIRHAVRNGVFGKNYGESHGMAKLRANQVLAILKLKGGNAEEVGRKYRVTGRTIINIWEGKKWNKVTKIR